MRFCLVACAVLALSAGACGGSGDPGSARTYGGPLESPGWRQGDALTMVLRPERPGGRAAAGMAVVTNRGREPATIERIAPVEPSRNLRVVAAYTADARRDFWASDQNSWPPPPGDYQAGSLRPARGREVPPVGAPGHELGLELLLVIDLPRRGRYTFRAVRVDYRVGERRYRVDVPTSYAICTPRRLKCADTPPYRPSEPG